MGLKACCRDCCTCEKTTQGISRFLTYAAFVITILTLSVAGWSSKCAPCVQEGGVEYCHYLGLFEWCEASNGREQCYDFNPRSVDKSLLSRGNYLAAQAFMVMSAIVSAFYVAVDIANWFVRITHSSRKVNVIKYTQDVWFFYLIHIFQGLFALIAQGIWAQQKQTHQHESLHCGKIYYDFGPSFALAALVWILNVINIVFRALFRKQFRDPVVTRNTPNHQQLKEDRDPSGEFHGVSTT